MQNEAKITDRKKNNKNRSPRTAQSKELFTTQKEITHPIQYNQTKPHYSQQHGVSNRHIYEEKNQSLFLSSTASAAPMMFLTLLSAQ